MLARYAILMLFGAVLSGYSQSASPLSSNASEKAQFSVSEIALSYTNFHQLTKSVVYVNPVLAMLCRGATKEEVDAARVQFGPHANTGILIYMNKPAADAFGANAAVFPVGAAIVKQKTIHGYTDRDGKRVREVDQGVGGMVKRSPGYDPKHGDSEYFYFEDKAKIESGRIPSCVQCHDSAKDKDHVFGTWNTTGG